MLVKMGNDAGSDVTRGNIAYAIEQITDDNVPNQELFGTEEVKEMLMKMSNEVGSFYQAYYIFSTIYTLGFIDYWSSWNKEDFIFTNLLLRKVNCCKSNKEKED